MYVREEALIYLQIALHFESFPYILLHLNDHVDQVRMQALKAVKEVLPLVSLKDCLDYYSLIEAIEITKRIDQPTLYKTFFKLDVVIGQILLGVFLKILTVNYCCVDSNIGIKSDEKGPKQLFSSFFGKY